MGRKTGVAARILPWSHVCVSDQIHSGILNERGIPRHSVCVWRSCHSPTNMTYRTFLDSTNRRWEVWLVVPTSAERRTLERRVASPAAAAAYAGVERRGATSRRVAPRDGSSLLPTGFENGWLCFESEGGEKRRLVPVPDDWESASVEQLENWCDRGKKVLKCRP